MTFALHLLVLLARNRLLLLPVFVILAWLSARRRLAACVLIGAAGVGNLVGGPLLCARLVYDHGQTAPARVTGTFATSTEINDREVEGYDVMIRTGDQVVSTRFEDDEENVYPLPDSLQYPQGDDAFNVRFLPGFPRDFVLVTDDDSPWARRQRCNGISLRLTTAQSRFDFARGAVPFRAPYVSIIDAYLAAGCAGGEPGAASFRADRARAVAGMVDPQP